MLKFRIVNCPPDLNEALVVIGILIVEVGLSLDQTTTGIMVPFLALHGLQIFPLNCLNCTATDDIVVTVNPSNYRLELILLNMCWNFPYY